MIILSPAKKLNLVELNLNIKSTNPVLIDKTKVLIKKIRMLNTNSLKKLLNISDKLSEINFQRFKDFNFEKENKTVKPAAFIFSGDTFMGLNITSFSSLQLISAQKKIRILSGLYGLLKPLDLIQPHRLEMGTNTKELIDNSLYDFWGDSITNLINKDIKENKSNFLINLASIEYFKSINLNKLETNVVLPKFYYSDGSRTQSVGMFSKRLRGAMASYCIKNKVSKLDKLKGFNEYGFSFDSIDEKNNVIFFTKKK